MIRQKGVRVKEEILRILQTPISVSDLKKKLPHVLSFGTIAYHLKALENEGLISKKKINDKRGRPTYYFLKTLQKSKIPVNQEDFKKQWNERELRIKLETLNLLSIKNYILNDLLLEIEGKTQTVDGDIDIVIDFTLDSKYAIPIIKITPEGKKFLEELSEKKS